MNTAPEITKSAEQSRERFAKLVELYRTLPGIEGDALGATPHDMYVAIVADAFHYAAEHDINMMAASVEAYQIYTDEGLE